MSEPSDIEFDNNSIGGSIGDDDDNHKQDGGDGGGGIHLERDSSKKNYQKKKKQKQHKRRGYNYKDVVLFPFIKLANSKQHLHRQQHTTKSDKWIAASSVNAASASYLSGNNNDRNSKRINNIVGSCFCFKQRSTVESSLESRTSDPNDPNFTFAMLKTLIETNDFYSRECNPHLDSSSY